MTEEEFLTLIHNHKGTMYCACNRYCQSFDHEDIIQDIIAETWRNLSTFNGKSAFNTWLHSISRNVCISLLRKHKTDKVREGKWGSELISANTENREAVLNKIEAAIQYAPVLSTLDPTNRRLLIMYLEGVPPREIAEQEGIDVNCLRANISRIKKRLYLRYGKSDEQFK